MKNKKIMNNNQSGFTLIELMVVLAIMGLLAAMFVPKMLDGRINSKIQTTKSETVAIFEAGNKARTRVGNFTGLVWTEIEDFLPGDVNQATEFGTTYTVSVGTRPSQQALVIPFPDDKHVARFVVDYDPSEYSVTGTNVTVYSE